MTGLVFLVSSGPVCWKSQMQKSTALSALEAEYMALCSAIREATWIYSMLKEPTLQNQSRFQYLAIIKGAAISQNLRTDARTKLIDVRHHFTSDKIEDQIIGLKRCETKNMMADFLTKPIKCAKVHLVQGSFEHLRRWLEGGVEFESADSCSDSAASHWGSPGKAAALTKWYRHEKLRALRKSYFSAVPAWPPFNSVMQCRYCHLNKSLLYSFARLSISFESLARILLRLFSLIDASRELVFFAVSNARAITERKIIMGEELRPSCMTIKTGFHYMKEAKALVIVQDNDTMLCTFKIMSPSPTGRLNRQ
jgi:hypothetical protein